MHLMYFLISNYRFLPALCFYCWCLP